MNHEIVHAKSGKKLGYGALVPAAAKLPVPKKDDADVQAEERRGSSSARNAQIYDLKDITTGKAPFGLDIYREGMVFASIEHPPVLGGTIQAASTTRRRSRSKACSQTVTLDTIKPPVQFQPLGGVAVIANSTWAAMQGRKKLKIDWNDGAARQLQFRAVQAGDDRAREAAREGRPQSGQCRRRVRQRRQGPRGDVLHADGGARRDGAAGRRGRVPERQGRSVDADAESAGRAGNRRRRRRHRQEERHLPRDAARRRLRQEIEARLRGRGGGAVEETRQARQGDLDARRRSSTSTSTTRRRRSITRRRSTAAASRRRGCSDRCSRRSGRRSARRSRSASSSTWG